MTKDKKDLPTPVFDRDMDITLTKPTISNSNDRVKEVTKTEIPIELPSEITKKAKVPKESKEIKLSLEKQEVKSRTRNELYRELSKNDKVMAEEDYYNFPNPVNRGIALAIDLLLLFGLYKLSFLAAPINVKLVHLFLDKYNLKLLFSETILYQLSSYFNLVCCLFFGIIIPTAFFNSSLGKKIMRLRVRGDFKYTLSIEQAFKREIILKPISILAIFGFFLPFFDKKKKSFHDKIVGTIVVKDE